jgi:glycogen debranching enzyme
MGVVWAHPIKLVDGYWFRLNDDWLVDASRFTSGPGYVRLDFPDVDGLHVTRTEFSPDGSPVVLIRLELRNPTRRTVSADIDVDIRSELMAAYPWGWSEPQNAGEFNGPDEAEIERRSGSLHFEEGEKDWHAIVKGSAKPSTLRTGNEFWGPLTAEQREAHTEFGKGTGGRLGWDLAVGRRSSRTLWLAVAGSDHSSRAAHRAAAVVDDASELLREKISQRKRLLSRSEINLPDEGIEAAFEWGKLNMADLTRTVFDAEIRDVDEGRAYPEPVGTAQRLRGIGAGFPDYPWFFGTDGAYTAFPLVASGQWDTAIDHLRSIRDVSRILNGDTGKVVHEVVTDGSVYWGANDDAGNTNETAQFATAVHLIWQWTGDDSFRDEMYPFVRDGLEYITQNDCVVTCDKDQDNWPEGNGMVERAGMGSEKLDVTAYTWQALLALQEMAASKGDVETAEWAGAQAGAIHDAFDPTWWMPSESLYADSLCNPGDEGDEGTNVCTAPDQQLQQRHWINATPMEVVGDRELADREHASAALDTLESSSFTGDCGLFHTGVGGGPTGAGELKCWTLPSSVMAVAEANYGRLGDDGALHYMRSIADQIDLEMPGALPEITPSPEYDPFVDLRDRAMFMQAWSSYGVQWPVIHHFLGIRPDVPGGGLYVVPDVPDSWPRLSVSDLKVGEGKVDVSARVEGETYTTKVWTPRGFALTLGHTLPQGSEVTAVILDGAPTQDYEVLETPRGTEVVVETTGGRHKLEVAVG